MINFWSEENYVSENKGWPIINQTKQTKLTNSYFIFVVKFNFFGKNLNTKRNPMIN